MEFLASITGTITSYLVDPIAHSFGYLIYYKRHVRNLSDQVEKLEALRLGVQGSVSAARRNGEEIRADVQNWMARVDAIVEEADTLLKVDVIASKGCFHGRFSSLTTRYRLSRKAKKKTLIATTLRNDGNFESVSNPTPPPGIETIYAGDFVAFKSTESAMSETLVALMGDNINLIGIHGMGGVGKTTLVKEIGKQVKEANLFDEVVMAVVSQAVDLKRIQDQMADMLGLKLKEKSEAGRAGRLCSRLRDEKRKLIILDDVWDKLDLVAIGIPFSHCNKNCKIILTTRRQQACIVMGFGNQATKIIRLHTLSKKDSWDLFRMNVDEIVDSPELNVVAKEVASECRGLPIALKTVGRAMRDKDLNEWKAAAQELKKSSATYIEGVDEEVYKCLKLSYNYLKGEEAKSCFLLCSLFPEDHSIKIEDLVKYGMGLGIFGDIDTLKEARLKAHSVVKILKASSLLSDDKEEEYVKMHDVVRDVALSVASDVSLVKAGINLKEWPKMKKPEDYTHISLMDNRISNLPDSAAYPKLRILLLQKNNLEGGIPGGFVEGMKALEVLDLSSTNKIQNSGKVLSLDPSFCNLTNLRTLLFNKRTLGDIAVLGKLKKLEILSFWGCKITELPAEIGQLTNLRLLDMALCYDLKTIAPNVISSLTRLEELYLSDVNITWEVEGTRGERSNANMAELKSLHHLTVCTVHMHSVECIPKDLSFDNLERFDITIGHGLVYHHYPHSTTMRLWNVTIPLPDGIKTLLQRKTERLSLSKLYGARNIIPDLVGGNGLNVLKSLSIQNFDERFEYLINTREWEHVLTPPKQLFFSNLEEINLQMLNIRTICHGALSGSSFSKLRVLKVKECPKLLYVAPFDLLKRLQNLEVVGVKNCHALEEVFILEEGILVEEEHRCVLALLSCLRELKLQKLSELKNIWKSGFTQLLQLHSLQTVCVDGCPKLKYLFQPAIAQSLRQLINLEVYRCNDLEEIVAKDQQTQEVQEVNGIIFPRLKFLQLQWLPNLTSFCSGSITFEWPSLERLTLKECPQMETFTAAGAQTPPKLEAIKIDQVEIMLNGEDINTIMQNHLR